MPMKRYLLILAVVLLLAGVTVLLMMALPANMRGGLIPILMVGAIAVRIASRH